MKPPLGEPGAARITHPAHAAPTQFVMQLVAATDRIRYSVHDGAVFLVMRCSGTPPASMPRANAIGLVLASQRRP